MLGRLQKLSRSIDPDVIEGIRNSTYRTIAGYETLAPAALLPALRKQRTWLEGLLDECGDQRQRIELFEIACHTSGLLAYTAVGCDNFPLARAYSEEAFQLGDYAESGNLRAWVRGIQSFCEYYAGSYERASAFAEDGLIHAAGGPQSARLAANGVARAKGRLGDAQGVHRAIGAAFGHRWAEESADSPSSICLGSYSPSQVAGNAATAYLSLLHPERVERYATQALTEMSPDDSPWGRSLILIDVARAQVLGESADLEAAAHYLREALEPARGVPMLQVRHRGAEFLRDATGRWGEVPELRALEEVLATGSGASDG
ncbi:hypothetical protein [Nocardia asteroides]|uniref:hypothetical protein n=1 Tax=Nocardia asteroides TaxID=1824 RepID=UPI001E5621DD|nr:hypothetical protein [Nocardia asteroides]UGT60428.1 hypothetical protein LTT61_25060 [Nocardia asteroides]